MGKRPSSSCNGIWDLDFPWVRVQRLGHETQALFTSELTASTGLPKWLTK